MVPAQLKDPLSLFLNEVETSYARQQNGKEHIKCTKLMVEDHYEVDCRYSVEECLGDMMKCYIYAELNNKEGKKNVDSNQKQLNGHSKILNDKLNGNHEQKKNKQE